MQLQVTLSVGVSTSDSSEAFVFVLPAPPPVWFVDAGSPVSHDKPRKGVLILFLPGLVETVGT